MMFGYFTGVAILGCCKKIRDEKIIKAAFIITISAMFLFFVANPIMRDSSIALSICYFFYTLGNAFLTPSLFSKEREIHEQGKGFGLVVAADSAGFLVAVIVVKIFDYLKLELEYMTLFSFVIFLISWFPYSAYEKTRENAARFSNAK
jgi:hypothetical protein